MLDCDKISIKLNHCDPEHTYFSGQTVCGKLTLELDEAETIRDISVSITGFCKVHWLSDHSDNKLKDGEENSENKRRYHEGCEEYFNKKISLINSDNEEHEMKPGIYKYSFRCKLPVDCPSSFDGLFGHVKYEIWVLVDRTPSRNLVKLVNLNVICPIDLLNLPVYNHPMRFTFEQSYHYRCIRSGCSETYVEVPSSGFFPGQVIPIKLTCHNSSRAKIAITFSIEKHTRFMAGNDVDYKSDEERITEMSTDPIPARTQVEWNLEMEVPRINVHNLRGCRYIDLYYEFQVHVKPMGWRGRKDTRPIFFGTTCPRVLLHNISMDSLQSKSISEQVVWVNRPPMPLPQ